MIKVGQFWVVITRSMRGRGRKALPYVFLNEDGADRVKEFRKSWKTACRHIGMPG